MTVRLAIGIAAAASSPDRIARASPAFSGHHVAQSNATQAAPAPGRLLRQMRRSTAPGTSRR